VPTVQPDVPITPPRVDVVDRVVEQGGQVERLVSDTVHAAEEDLARVVPEPRELSEALRGETTDSPTPTADKVVSGLRNEHVDPVATDGVHPPPAALEAAPDASPLRTLDPIVMPSAAPSHTAALRHSSVRLSSSVSAESFGGAPFGGLVAASDGVDVPTDGRESTPASGLPRSSGLSRCSTEA